MAKLFCTDFVAADGHTYAGPNIIANDWPDAMREGAARGLRVHGELVCEIPADAPPGFEIGADEILRGMLAVETVQ